MPTPTLKHKNVGTDNLIALVSANPPKSVKIGRIDCKIDGKRLANRMIDGPHGPCVSKNELDALGYPFLGDMVQLVNRGIAIRVYAGTSTNGNPSSTIQLSPPSKKHKEDDLHQYQDFLIPNKFLSSLLGVKSASVV